MTTVGRRLLDHPSLATTGGSGLHAAIELLYTIISNDLGGRYSTYSAIADATVTTIEHGYGVAFDELSILLYTGSYPNLTKVEDPTAAGWTIAATSGFEKTKIDVTAPGSGGPHTFAVFAIHGRTAKFLDALDDVNLATPAEDGQTLVYDSSTGKFIPGASGDSSFKVQSVSDPNATIKGGYLLLDDGRELGTHDGSGSASTDFGKDLTIDLDTVLGGNPANATAYYLYLDLSTLGASTTQTDTGRVVYPVTISNFVLSTIAPEFTDLRRYIPRDVIKSATSGTVWSGSGSAFKTLAFLPGQTADANLREVMALNYIDVPTPTKNIGLATVYADAAGVLPVDGTGGSPDVTLTRNTTSPIRGIADFKFSKDAANRQGQGFAIPFQIPATDKNTKARVKFRMDTTSTNYASGDLGLFVYDVTNSVLITPAITAIPKVSAIFETSFDLSTGTSYRLIGHVTSTNALAYDLFLDDFQVDIEKQGQASVVGPATAWTPAFTNATGLTITSKGSYQRIGDALHMTGSAYFAGSGSDASPLRLTLPFTGITAVVADYAGGVAGIKNADINSRNMYLRGVSSQNYLEISTQSTPTTSVNGTGFGDGSSSNQFSFLEFSVVIPINEWVGQSLVNQGVNDVEYAYNTGTWDGNDTTNFGYGPNGTLMGGALSAARTKTVRFISPSQPSDTYQIEYSTDTSGVWVPAGSRVGTGGAETDGYYNIQIANTYGSSIDTSTISGTDVDVRFGQYISNASATYGGTGQAWPSNVRWRVKKTRAGAAVGFGQATSTNLGLVKGGSVPGTTSGAAIPAGQLGQRIVSGAISATPVSSPTYVDVTGASLPLTSGAWMIFYNGLLRIDQSGGGAIACGIYDASNNHVGGNSGYKGADASREAVSSFAYVNIAANTTYKLRIASSGATSSFEVADQVATNDAYSAFFAVRVG